MRQILIVNRLTQELTIVSSRTKMAVEMLFSDSLPKVTIKHPFSSTPTKSFEVSDLVSSQLQIVGKFISDQSTLLESYTEDVCELETLFDDIRRLTTKRFAFNAVHGIGFSKDASKLMIGRPGGFNLLVYRGEKFIANVSLDSLFSSSTGGGLILDEGIIRFGEDGEYLDLTLVPSNRKIKGNSYEREYSCNHVTIASKKVSELYRVVMRNISFCYDVGFRDLSLSVERATNCDCWIEKLHFSKNKLLKLKSKELITDGRSSILLSFDSSSANYTEVGRKLDSGNAYSYAGFVAGKAAAIKNPIIIRDSYPFSTTARLRDYNFIRDRAKKESIITSDYKNQDQLNELIGRMARAAVCMDKAKASPISDYSNVLERAYGYERVKDGSNHLVMTNSVVLYSYESAANSVIAKYLESDIGEQTEGGPSSDSTLTLCFTKSVSDSQQTITLATFKDDVNSILSSYEKERERLISFQSSFMLESLNNRLEDVDQEISAKITALVELLGAELEIKANQAVLVNELAKIMQYPVLFGPNAVPLGVVSDFLQFDQSGTRVSSTFSATRSFPGGLTSSRKKSSWGVYNYLQGEGANTHWDRHESQESCTFTPSTVRWQGVKGIRLDSQTAANLGIFVSSITNTICVRATRSSGSKTQEVVPNIYKSYVGLEMNAFFTQMVKKVNEYLSKLPAISRILDTIKTLNSSLSESFAKRGEIFFEMERLNSCLSQLGVVEERIKTYRYILESLKDGEDIESFVMFTPTSVSGQYGIKNFDEQVLRSLLETMRFKYVLSDNQRSLADTLREKRNALANYEAKDPDVPDPELNSLKNELSRAGVEFKNSFSKEGYTEISNVAGLQIQPGGQIVRLDNFETLESPVARTNSVNTVYTYWVPVTGMKVGVKIHSTSSGVHITPLSVSINPSEILNPTLTLSLIGVENSVNTVMAFLKKAGVGTTSVKFFLNSIRSSLGQIQGIDYQKMIHQAELTDLEKNFLLSCFLYSNRKEEFDSVLQALLILFMRDPEQANIFLSAIYSKETLLDTVVENRIQRLALGDLYDSINSTK